MTYAFSRQQSAFSQVGRDAQRDVRGSKHSHESGFHVSAFREHTTENNIEGIHDGFLRDDG